MIQLSKRLLYSIEAVLDIACHEGPAPVRSVDVTQREGIPARLPYEYPPHASFIEINRAPPR